MKFRTTAILLLLSVVSSPVFAWNPALPSRGLEQRIEFWKNVYTQYGADDLIIHDRIHVNLIYGVAARSDINRKITEIQNALREIQYDPEAPNKLSPTAAKIYESIIAQGLLVSSSLIDTLIARMHIQIGIRERFLGGIVRSGRYVGKFREIMKEHGLPEELALLPLVESSFQNAKSRVGAAGIWQFTRGTGRLYMTINRKVDERLDPVRSSEAAARFLYDNYRALGTWPLAITGYNHGRGGMMQAQKLYGSDLPEIISRYRGPVFGYASMNFYAEFLAALEVYENHRQYFGELTLDMPDPEPGEAPDIRVSNLPVTRASAPAKNTTAGIVAKYKVRPGDTLSEIAQRFGMPVHHLMKKNKLNKSMICAGQILLVEKLKCRSGRSTI